LIFVLLLIVLKNSNETLLRKSQSPLLVTKNRVDSETDPIVCVDNNSNTLTVPCQCTGEGYWKDNNGICFKTCPSGQTKGKDCLNQPVCAKGADTKATSCTCTGTGFAVDANGICNGRRRKSSTNDLCANGTDTKVTTTCDCTGTLWLDIATNKCYAPCVGTETTNCLNKPICANGTDTKATTCTCTGTGFSVDASGICKSQRRKASTNGACANGTVMTPTPIPACDCTGTSWLDIATKICYTPCVGTETTNCLNKPVCANLTDTKATTCTCTGTGFSVDASGICRSRRKASTNVACANGTDMKATPTPACDCNGTSWLDIATKICYTPCVGTETTNCLNKPVCKNGDDTKAISCTCTGTGFTVDANGICRG